MGETIELSGENEPYSKSKSQDGTKTHPSSFCSLGEDPSTSEKFRYDASSISTVTSFVLPLQSARKGRSKVINEDEYEQFGSESDGESSKENAPQESRNDSDVVQSPSASVSGRLRLRPEPRVTTDLR